MWDALTRREATVYIESLVLVTYLNWVDCLIPSRQTGWSVTKVKVDPNCATDQSRMLRPNLSFKVESRRTTKVATNFVAHLLRRRLAASN
jgi:hypothetical protein